MPSNRPKNILQSISQKSGGGAQHQYGTQQQQRQRGREGGGGPLSNNYMTAAATADCDVETVPGDFDADDMIVMDGVTIEQTTDGGGTIDHHYMMANHQLVQDDIRSGGEPVDVSADVDEIIKYQDEETTSQFQHQRAAENQDGGEGNDQLSNAQTNVNALFEQLKTKFATVNHDM